MRLNRRSLFKAALGLPLLALLGKGAEAEPPIGRITAAPPVWRAYSWGDDAHLSTQLHILSTFDGQPYWRLETFRTRDPDVIRWEVYIDDLSGGLPAHDDT